MAIQGPLRDLGMHDLFQLLDMSRKTGVLRVASSVGAADAEVRFRSGRVVHATMRGQPASAEQLLGSLGRIGALDLDYARRMAQQRGGGCTALQILVEAGAVPAREVSRLWREHVESIVFELLTWRDGHFSFEERPVETSGEVRLSVNPSSLLMESARRADEWSRIADRVPGLSSVPALAAGGGTGAAVPLALAPHEWEVLTMIDGRRDLRGIAAAMSRPAIEIARVVHGLVGAGVLEVG